MFCFKELICLNYECIEEEQYAEIDKQCIDFNKGPHVHVIFLKPIGRSTIPLLLCAGHVYPVIIRKRSQCDAALGMSKINIAICQ